MQEPPHLTMPGVIKAFGDDTHMTAPKLMPRLGLPPTPQWMQWFAMMCRKHRISAHRLRYSGKTARYYRRSDFDLVQRTAKPLPQEYHGPDVMSVGQLKMQIRGDAGRLARRDSRIKKLFKENEALAAELKRLERLAGVMCDLRKFIEGHPCTCKALCYSVQHEGRNVQEEAKGTAQTGQMPDQTIEQGTNVEARP